MRRRGSLFELVTGREPVTSGRSLSGSDNAINTRHRLESRLPKPTQPILSRRVTNAGVTIVRPTKEARKAEIVAAVTRRLYTARKKPDPRADPPPSLSENAEEAGQLEPKELKLCSNARARLQEISKRALALGLHRRLRKDSDTQTEEITSALRVKEKAVSTDEPTREVSVETTTTACEANLFVDFGKRVELAEKSSQWKAECSSIGTQSSTFLPPPFCLLPPTPLYGPPFWLSNWWPNMIWGCCHHEPKRLANISVDSADDFSDDSLESLCGISRMGPDGASGDTVEPKPALWETLTLRSGKQFKEGPSLYQTDVFRTPHPLASLFQKELSYLGREDKGTETKKEIEVEEKACNTEPLTKTTDEESQTTPCTVHENDMPCSFRHPSALPEAPHFQLVCDFTVACGSLQAEPVKLTLHRNNPNPCCACDGLNLPPVTATPEVFPTSSAAHQSQARPQPLHWPKTPFSTPDIIAQASNDSEKLASEDTAPRLTEPHPSTSETRNVVCGLWEGKRPFISLDSTLSQPQQPREDSSRARSLDSIFQPKTQTECSLPNSANEKVVKKFRLPCLSENKPPSAPVSITARSLYEVPSPPRAAQSPAKRITPSSFLSPKGRRLLLTWLNNPGSKPSTGNFSRSGRKTFDGRASRHHAGFREKCHRRVAKKRAGKADTDKVSVYHNLSLLLSEATNYVRTITPRHGSSSSQKHSQESQVHLTLTGFSQVYKEPRKRDSGTQSESPRNLSFNTDHAVTAEKAVSTTETVTAGTQCALNFSTHLPKIAMNTFALFWISRSTQTDVSMWNDAYLLEDDILLEAQSTLSDDLYNEPEPCFLNCSNLQDRRGDIQEILDYDEFRSKDRYVFSPTGRSTLCLNDLTRRPRLPCQHSSPRAYLQHLVSLRRGIVEACQSPPARPTGVGWRDGIGSWRIRRFGTSFNLDWNLLCIVMGVYSRSSMRRVLSTYRKWSLN